MSLKVKPLTSKQKDTLDFINSFILKHGYSPSLKEIAKFVGTENLSTAQYFVRQLEKKGHLRKASHKSRGITPLSQSQAVPLLGTIAAGKPIEPIETPEAISVPNNIKLSKRHSYYALKIQGDSMIDMGILDNDVVLIQHQMTADNGDVVVAITENGATLKIFKQIGDKVRLEPRNKKYPTIVPKELEIRGKFIGLVRSTL